MAAPRKLWKTEVVIWSRWDPQLTPVSVLAREGESGSAYIAKAHSELVAGWWEDPDAPSEEFINTIGTHDELS